MVEDVSEGADFVVEIDRQKAERSKERSLRAYIWLAFLSAGLAGAAGALAVAVVTETATEGLTAEHTSSLLRTGLFVMALALAMAGLWFRAVQQVRRTAGPNDVALRLSARGVHSGMAGEPDVIFVPWALVAAFDERRVGPRRTHLLVLKLVPGASASTGAVGLERPDVQRMVRLLGGIAWRVDLLRQPPSAIEAARARLAPTH
jgi:hypothetical protein